MPPPARTSNDGVDEPTGKGTRPGRARLVRTAGRLRRQPRRSRLLKSLLGPGLGVTAADVPDLGVLLVGPMAAERR